MIEAQITPEEAAAFEGLQQGYIEMEERIAKTAPKCHFRPMGLERGDGENYNDEWYECYVCGHTKPVLRRK